MTGAARPNLEADQTKAHKPTPSSTYTLDIETIRDAEHRETMHESMKYKEPASGMRGMVPGAVAEYFEDQGMVD